MTLWIQNVSKHDIQVGRHFDCGENSMLIRILDPAENFPPVAHKFKEVHQFEFLDIENEDSSIGEFAISDTQAEQIVALLRHAYENKMQVVVHCHAGLCRSGAVVEAGIQMGFTDTEKLRMPNSLVKRKLFKAAGMEYNPQYSSFAEQMAEKTLPYKYF